MSVSSRYDPRLRAILGLILLVGLSLIGSPAAFAQTEGPIYIVVEGDTLSGIAFKFGVDLEALVEANGIDDPSRLFPGQELLVPGYEGIQGILQTPPVGLGETLRTVSLSHQNPIEPLQRLNRVIHPGSLYLGQAIILAATESPSEPAVSLWQAPAGVSLVELAVLQGVNPWTLRARSYLDHRTWLLPGEALLAEELPSTAFSTIPFESMTLQPEALIQGRTFEILVETSGSSWVEGRIGDHTLNFQHTPNGQTIALQGIHALQPTGLMVLEVVRREEGTSANPVAFTQPLQVNLGGYGMEALQVPPQTIDPEATGPEDAFVKEILAGAVAERLWDGVFAFPASYYDSFPSVFGTRRSYNGSEYVYYHTGLDLFGSTTTVVLASARGRVIFSDLLTARGNTTYIDHGWGIYTGYLHQSQILVEDGEIVEAGQIIGYVGGTGRVTGPHLHWEIWVGGVPVNPIEWTQTTFP